MKQLNLNSDYGCFLLIGAPRKGKTNLCRYLLLKNSLENFKGSAKYEFGIVFSATSWDGDYDFLPKQYVYTTYDQSVLQQYIEGLEKMKQQGKKIPRNFVVLDDQIGLINKHDPFLINWFSKIRHYRTHVYLLAQHLKTGANTTLREVCTHAFMFNSKSFNTIQSLFENFGQLFENFADFKKTFQNVTKEKYSSMLYLQENDDIDQNYLQFIAPDTSNWQFKMEY